MFWCIWRLSHHDISKKTAWKKTPVSREGRSGSRWLFSSGRCSRLGIPLEMEHGLRLRCCLPFQCWLQPADKARNFWMETLGLVTWWNAQGNACEMWFIDSLSIAWVFVGWFFPHLETAKGFWTTPLTRGWKIYLRHTFCFAMGLPHGAVTTSNCDQVDPSLLTWQHASKELGGSDGRGWRYGWWLQICTSACSILATCLREGDDIFDIGPLVWCEVLLPKFYAPFDHGPGIPLVCWGGLCFLWAQRLVACSI